MKLFNTFQKRIGLIFLAFFLLVSISVVASYLIIETQKQDALVINLAGRQRMLIQSMTKDVLEIERDTSDMRMEHINTLKDSVGKFDATLTALIQGGNVPYPPYASVYLPATTPPNILAQLQEVSGTWQLFRHTIQPITAPQASDADIADAIVPLREISPVLLQQADEIVRLYENSSNRKVFYLQRIQVVFFLSALILLAVGVVATQKAIAPLHALGKTAKRIGDGDLNTPVAVAGVDEIQLLARTLDSMRRQLHASQSRLEERVSQQASELATAFELSQEIVAELNIDHLLTSVTNRAKSLANADVASLCLLAPAGETLRLVANSNGFIPPEDMEQPIGDGLSGDVVFRDKTVSTDTVCANCIFMQHIDGDCMATPLKAGEKILGALCVIKREPNHINSDHTRALSLLANSAAIAITNAQLVKEKQIQAQQAASLAERERLAAELHDNLAQTLSFLNLKTDHVTNLLHRAKYDDTLSELQAMQSAIQLAYGQVRAALVGLREPISAPGDITQKIQSIIADFSDATQLPVQLTLSNSNTLTLPRTVQTQALHIIKESLANIRRHAHAGRVHITVKHCDTSVCFSVNDDGVGFDPTRTNPENHLGLMIMHTRAKRSGGQLEVQSTPEYGTTVTATFPLMAAEKHLF